jgi:hypothetical protein
MKEKDVVRYSDLVLRYVGDGAYLPLVPARDLTAEEAEKFREIIELAAANGQRLYEAVEQPPARKEEK